MNVLVTQTGVFLSLSLEASKAYVSYKQKLDATDGDPRSNDVWNISISLSEQYSIAIVFAQAFLEAFIFDYGSAFLGADYVITHLDRLKLPSKYVAISKLISGENSVPENRIREIVGHRNDLIHSKSFHGNNIENKKLDKLINTYDAQDRVAKQLPKSLLSILQGLYDHHPCDITAHYIARIKSHRYK
jgi:hypothetical protein